MKSRVRCNSAVERLPGVLRTLAQLPSAEERKTKQPNNKQQETVKSGNVPEKERVHRPSRG